LRHLLQTITVTNDEGIEGQNCNVGRECTDVHNGDAKRLTLSTGQKLMAGALDVGVVYAISRPVIDITPGFGATYVNIASSTQEADGVGVRFGAEFQSLIVPSGVNKALPENFDKVFEVIECRHHDPHFTVVKEQVGDLK